MTPRLFVTVKISWHSHIDTRAISIMTYHLSLRSMVAEEMVVSAAAAKVMVTIAAEVEGAKREMNFPLEVKLKQVK